MKAISLIICMLNCFWIFGQSQTHSIADVAVAGQKTAVAGLLGAELGLRKRQKELLEKLVKAEKEYDSKRSVGANFKANTLVILAVQAQLEFLRIKIENVKSNIGIVKVASFGVGQGLSRLSSALEAEETYFQKLQSENLMLGAGIVISGGTGHMYTAYLRLLLRIIPIKNSILQIDQEVKAKMTVTRIFAK